MKQVLAFLRAEDGAVTVDWVVLTAALVGLGLAVAGVMSGGLQDLSNDTRAQLEGQTITTRFSFVSDLFGTDFANGAGDWVGGSVATLAGFGEVLQIAGGDTAELQLDVPSGANSATVTFDMIGGDDLNGDAATIFINGQAVAIYADNHGSVTTSDNGVAGISVSVNQIYNNDPVGAGNHGHDSRATYTIKVDNPGATLSFAVSSNSDESVNSEFFAIDDVSISTQ